MEHNRNSKLVALISVFIASIVLTIAFAALTKNMTIQSHINVNAGGFSVKFSSSATKLEENTIVPNGSLGSPLSATINNSGTYPTLTNIGGTLNGEANPFLEYTFYVLNDGSVDAYLKSINIAPVSGSSSPVACVITGTTATADAGRVASACTNIDYTVAVYNSSGTLIAIAIRHANTVTLPSSGNTPGFYLLKSKSGSTYNYHKVVVTINLNYNNLDKLLTTGGNYDVKFGDVSLIYDSTL